MSDLLTTYTTFSAINYKGENSLSSFSLSSTPFTFIPDLPSGPSSRVLWSFGDGTTSNSLCAVKSYAYPGDYTVNLFVYDCYGNVVISSYSQDVTIHDLFPLTLNIGVSSGDYTVLSAYNGQITGPLSVTSQYPIYQEPIDVYYTIYNGIETSFYNISSNKYAYLERFNTLYDKVYNYSLSSYQYVEIDRVIPTYTKIFGKIVDGNIVTCPPSDTGAFFIGVSGQKDVYFKSDTASEDVRIKFKFDNTHIYSPFVYDETYVDYFNNLGVILSAVVTENLAFSALSITSNGINGEGFPIDGFNISPIKFEDTKIPFVVKIIDQNNFSYKSVGSNVVSLYVLSGNNTPVDSYYYDLSSLSHTISGFEHPGSERYYIKFKNLTSMLSNVSISAVSVAFPLVNSGDDIISFGQSSNFNVYTDQYYSIYKKNENFDAEQMFKDLRFQEFLLDKKVLFEDFMGTIFGGVSSTYDTLGKKIYEKITNFVENNADVDRSEIYSLLSQMEMMGMDVNIYDSTLMNYPEKIKRLLNLASIDYNKLMGTPNQFKENFNLKGQTQKTEFGTNLGPEINTTTYLITAGMPIVALEKFSGTYTLLNTFQPLCASSGAFYHLSSYNSNWGWPLVLPTPFTHTDFSKYYIFFEYNDVIDGRNTNFTIDFSNPMTTILSSTSYDGMFGANGVFENMITNTLYSSLSLFET